jgi:hypothetical protein
MEIFWGSFMALVGLFLLVSATLRTNLVIYQLLVARSQILWGNHVHLFHQSVGVILMILGLLWASGVIWKKA